MNVSDIEKAVSALSADELKTFRQWFADFKATRRQNAKASPAERRDHRAERHRKTPVPTAPGRSWHRPTKHYWDCYYELPEEIRVQADKSLVLLNENSNDPSLQFKKNGLIWSASIGTDHQALAIEAPNGFLWFWVGHRE